MSLPLLAAAVLVALSLGYRFYGRFVASRYDLDDSTKTPAIELEDGADYVPAKPGYLLGQHFSAIAAAGPIAGPIIACQQFGWLPCVLWIVLGAIFIGAVHDFSALVASVRHRAGTIAEVVRTNLSRRAWICFLLFIWIALVYVIVAFTEITAGTFVGQSEELKNLPEKIDKGGAVAFAATAYLALAMVLGLVQRAWKRAPLWLLTLVFVPATLALVWLGTQFSSSLVVQSSDPQKSWGLIILAYCFVASLLPMWLLLQPRGYLGGFILYLALAIGMSGIFFGDFAIEQPPFKGWVETKEGSPTPTGSLLPFLFVTIACGACSGFHGLVCSGTTSKQISKESHCRPVGYGGMLLEGFVAIIALATIMTVAKGKGGPGEVYGDGLARFLSSIIGRDHYPFALVFGTMVFSTFVFDTLDVATRLGRYLLQELFGLPGKIGGVFGTLLTVSVPALFVFTGEHAPLKPPSFMAYWTLFGASNQLLAALTLLGVAVWLKRSGRPTWFVIAPMLFVMAITVWALVLQAFSGLGGVGAVKQINGGVAVALLGLTLMLIIEAMRAVRRFEQKEGA